MPSQTIFVRSLPVSASNDRLLEIFSEIGPVKQCFVVKEKGTDKCRGFGFVTYALEEDSQRALKEIIEYDGQKLSLSVAKKKLGDKRKTEPSEAPKEKEQKSQGFRKSKLKARLIIRNLSFKCSEDDLKEVFAKFGTILEAKIPLKPDGKKRGFAFVQFKNVSEASKALTATNLKEIKGRQVAVDWAVAKDKFIATQGSSGGGTVIFFISFTNFSVKKSNLQKSDSESDSEDEDEEKEAPKKTQSDDDSDEHDSDEEEDEDDDDDDDDDNDDEEEKEVEEKDDDDMSQEAEDDDDSFDSDEDDDDDDDDDDDESDQKKKTPKKPLPSDIKEGRTVFIRNLSFDTEEEGLEEVLLQYGEMNYIKIVLHPDTEHSKGCAFVQFKTKEAAERCIAAAQDEAENGGIRVDGRKLLIVAAVTREDATKLKTNKVKVETGTRNLYLAREGLIRAGTKAAEGVPEADMIKRARFEELKRTKLRDIHVFVSKTRLCVHNLPKSVDNKKLKALCLQALKGSKGVRLTECRVMYDKKPMKGQTMGQSLGYGFVQFQEHEHALGTLRYLNNNPDIFGSHKRPIVEFSLEDSRKLKMKEIRQQKNKVCMYDIDIQLSVTFLPLSAPQSQKKDRQYSGFQTNPEVEHVDLENGKKRKKILPFPSHRGPKIRMRDKGKQKPPPPKKGRPGSSRRDRQRRHIEKPTQPRNQKSFKRRDGDRFDSLVQQYKKKLMGTGDKTLNVKRSKWFDS
uniref:RNA-binding protein 28 n=1 Tax=Sphaeramia orbicularis TaxID=375764 RepID=A0A673AKN4_9TELE